MSDQALHDEVRRYYEGTLREHGVTARGVDWNDAESQELRFQELMTLVERDPDATIVDYGCGWGALAGYLRRHGHRGSYLGYDLSPEMVGAATALADAPSCQFTSSRAGLPGGDYSLASGIFNVKLGASDAEWEAYVYRTLADIASLSTRGFAFNVLTSYSDPDKRRSTLYYADPLVLFDYCKRTYSRAVSLLHDYPLYEFTLLVRF